MGFFELDHIVRRSGKGIGGQEGIEYCLLGDESSTAEEPGLV